MNDGLAHYALGRNRFLNRNRFGLPSQLSKETDRQSKNGKSGAVFCEEFAVSRVEGERALGRNGYVPAQLAIDELIAIFFENVCDAAEFIHNAGDAGTAGRCPRLSPRPAPACLRRCGRPRGRKRLPATLCPAPVPRIPRPRAGRPGGPATGPPPSGAARVTPQVTLVLQRGQLVGDAGRAGQADRLADLAHGRGIAAPLDRLSDYLEHLPLPPGEHVVGIGMLGHLGDHGGDGALGLASRFALGPGLAAGPKAGGIVPCPPASRAVIHLLNLRT